MSQEVCKEREENEVLFYSRLIKRSPTFCCKSLPLCLNHITIVQSNKSYFLA